MSVPCGFGWVMGYENGPMDNCGPAVKEFLKSVNIFQSYAQEQGGLLFDSRCSSICIIIIIIIIKYITTTTTTAAAATTTTITVDTGKLS